MSLQNKIWLGVLEIQAGTRTGDIKRSANGQEIIRQTLAEISAGQKSGLLAELNAAASEMMEATYGYLSGGAMRAFLRARERHQKALAEIAGGNGGKEDDTQRGG